MQQMIAQLQKAEAYPHPVETIDLIQTAISRVFLTGKHAYKIYKPVNFGFLDFTTLEQRKQTCDKEVDFNKLISPELYEGVVPITERNGIVQVGGEGIIIEHAIKMKQCNQENLMQILLIKEKITSNDIRKLAARTFHFHQKAPTSEEIAQYGSIQTITFNWNENFEQTEKYVNKIIPEDLFLEIKQKVLKFINENHALFQQRIKKNKIRHCHGDLHTGNVFIENNEPLIFDGIVFNMRFPCCDVISEIAFMAMDLDFHGREDFSKLFIEEYKTISRDEDIDLLLDFYKCYRAYIRGKINCFKSEDQQLDEKERNEAIEEAKQYFSLAKRYAQSL